MKIYKLTIAYDGTRYRGWQRLGNSNQTIQGKLESVLSRMEGRPVEVSGSGRTDAGAHARGQVASVPLQTDAAPQEICRYLNHYLPEDIGVLSVEPAALQFHARYNALRKTYEYRVWNSQQPCIFERKYCYVLDAPLDLEQMRCAASDVLGTHDFMEFCSNKQMKKSTVRTIHALEIIREGPELRFRITGDGFLYNMVRILCGTLLEIGQHQRPADDIPDILASRDRTQAGFTAPPQGLCLMEVEYE